MSCNLSRVDQVREQNGEVTPLTTTRRTPAMGYMLSPAWLLGSGTCNIGSANWRLVLVLGREQRRTFDEVLRPACHIAQCIVGKRFRRTDGDRAIIDLDLAGLDLWERLQCGLGR